jgi:hypothetical protein
MSEDVNARNTVTALAQALDAPADDCPEIGLWKLKFVHDIYPDELLNLSRS